MLALASSPSGSNISPDSHSCRSSQLHVHTVASDLLHVLTCVFSGKSHSALMKGEINQAKTFLLLCVVCTIDPSNTPIDPTQTYF